MLRRCGLIFPGLQELDTEEVFRKLVQITLNGGSKEKAFLSSFENIKSLYGNVYAGNVALYQKVVFMMSMHARFKNHGSSHCS